MNDYPVLIGGVGLVKGRIKNIGQAMASVCEDVKPVIEKNRVFEGMPFKEINMVIRWGDERMEAPEIGPLRRTQKSLEVATTISLEEGKAVENSPEKLKGMIKGELIKVLRELETKYGLGRINI